MLLVTIRPNTKHTVVANKNDRCIFHAELICPSVGRSFVRVCHVLVYLIGVHIFPQMLQAMPVHRTAQIARFSSMGMVGRRAMDRNRRHPVCQPVRATKA